MKMFNFANFEMPGVISRLWQSPPRDKPHDTRHVADVIASPRFGVYDPASLNFPDHSKPVVPGAGGYCPMGLGPVVYDAQPQWDRAKVCEVGPVREFFRGVMFDNRVKHL